MKHLLVVMILCSLGMAGYSSVTPSQKKTGIYSSIYKDYGSLLDLYKNLNPTKLQSSDEEEVKSYLLPYNSKIVNYVAERYGENLAAYFAMDDPMIFFSGTLVAQYEYDQATYTPQSKTSPQEIMGCLADAIGIAKGVKELIASYQALLNGSANFGTLFSVVKNIMRRYAAWFMVGYLVYEFGDCIGWW